MTDIDSRIPSGPPRRRRDADEWPRHRAKTRAAQQRSQPLYPATPEPPTWEEIAAELDKPPRRQR